MKFTNILLSSAMATTILAYPGAGKWKQTLAELQRRAAAPIDSPEDSTELLGDLVSPGPTTPVGKLVADILVGNADALSSEIIMAAPAPLGSAACKADTCCTWKYVADEMLSKFKGQSLRCNSFARGAIRLGFHDAAAWQKGAAYGGADGSILLTDELNRPANKGLEEIAVLTKAIYAKYQPYGVSMADVIQMGATVATVACPLGPRIRSFVGRKDNPTAAIENLLPDVNADADSLIKLFEDKTIKPHGLTALVGAHSTSQQRFFNPQRALDPQDSTPGVWDVAVYPQTLDPNAPKRVLKFPSDVKFSVHPRMASEWKAFADPATGQAHWNDDYSKEYIRLSLLGVNNINSLTECSKVLPPAVTSFQPPDKSNVDIWANGGFQSLGDKFGQLMAGASLTTNQTLPQLGVDPMQAWSGFGRPPPGPPSAQPSGVIPGQGQQPPPAPPQNPRPPPPKANAPAGSVAPVPVASASPSVVPIVSSAAISSAAPLIKPSASVAPVIVASSAPVLSSALVIAAPSSTKPSASIASVVPTSIVVPPKAGVSASPVSSSTLIAPVLASSAAPPPKSSVSAAPVVSPAPIVPAPVVSSAPAPIAAAPVNAPAVAAPAPAAPANPSTPPPQANGWPMNGWGMGQGWTYPSPPANNGPRPQSGNGQYGGGPGGGQNQGGDGRGRPGGTFRKLRMARGIVESS